MPKHTIRQRGLRVESVLDGTFTTSNVAVAHGNEAGAQDLVLFNVKMYQNAQAIEATRPHVGSQYSGPHPPKWHRQRGSTCCGLRCRLSDDRLRLHGGKNLTQVGAAGDKGDLVSGPGQQTTEISADTAGAHDRYFHRDCLLLFSLPQSS